MYPENSTQRLKPAFRPKSLPAQLTEVLREDISSGKLGPVLPGERQLALAYHVSRVTMRRVIEVIENEGVLSRRTNGRLIKGQGGGRRTKRSTGIDHVGFITRFQMHELARVELIWLDQFREMLAISGHRLTHHNRPDFYHKEPGSQLEKLAGENPKTIWLLHRSTPAMQAFFPEKKLPAIIVGSPHEGCSLPFVDKDQYALSFNAACLAKRLGYKHLIFLHSVDPAAGVRLAMRGLEDGVRETKLKLTLKRYHYDIFSILDTILHMPELAAERCVLLVDFANIALRAMTYLLGKGLRIPRDLGVMCRDSASYLKECCPSLVHYECEPRLYAQRLHRCVMRLGNGESINAKAYKIIPTLIKGGSL